MHEAQLGDTVETDFSTHGDTGANTAADSTPTVTVYKNGSAVGSLTNQNATSFGTGLYRFTFAASSGNGFAANDLIEVVSTAVIGGVTSSIVLKTFKVKAWQAEVTAIKAKTDNLPAAPASTTNITAGTITTVTNLTNAPTNGDLTATMKASVTTACTASTPTAAAVTGSVGSVTGAVGSVTGAVGSVTAGVTVTTNNDKTGYGLSSSAVQAVWDALTSALTTVGSIGKLLVDNINATISSRLASASYTAPLDAAGTRTAVGLATNNLDTQLAAIAASSPPSASAIADAVCDEALSGHTTAGTVGASLADIYAAQIDLSDDEANTQDEYSVQWFKNGAPVTSGITSPTIQVIKRAGGSDLVAQDAMTQIGSTGAYKYDATDEANRISAGEAVVVQVQATIGGSTRTWRKVVSRDSAAA